MAVENIDPSLGLTAVKGEGSLIQGWRDGGYSCEKSGCVGSTGEEGSEPPAVGFTACVETRFVDCVYGRYCMEDIVDVSDLSSIRQL